MFGLFEMVYYFSSFSELHAWALNLYYFFPSSSAFYIHISSFISYSVSPICMCIYNLTESINLLKISLLIFYSVFTLFSSCSPFPVPSSLHLPSLSFCLNPLIREALLQFLPNVIWFTLDSFFQGFIFYWRFIFVSNPVCVCRVMCTWMQSGSRERGMLLFSLLSHFHAVWASSPWGSATRSECVFSPQLT